VATPSLPRFAQYQSAKTAYPLLGHVIFKMSTSSSSTSIVVTPVGDRVTMQEIIRAVQLASPPQMRELREILIGQATLSETATTVDGSEAETASVATTSTTTTTTSGGSRKLSDEEKQRRLAEKEAKAQERAAAKAQRDAQKAAEAVLKAQKAQERADAKAIRDAEKAKEDAEKAARKAEREAKKAQREAEMAVKKAATEAKKAEAALKKAEKEAEAERKKAEKAAGKKPATKVLPPVAAGGGDIPAYVIDVIEGETVAIKPNGDVYEWDPLSSEMGNLLGKISDDRQSIIRPDMPDAE
jgi:hypothetical protein